MQNTIEIVVFRPVGTVRAAISELIKLPMFIGHYEIRKMVTRCIFMPDVNIFIKYFIPLYLLRQKHHRKS